MPPRRRPRFSTALLTPLLAQLADRPAAGLRLLLGGLAGTFVFAFPTAPLLAKYLVMGAAMGGLAPAPGAAAWQRRLWRVGVGVLLLGTGLEVSTWLLT